MEPFNKRTIDINKPIKVYRNLHRNCYSVKQGNLVVAHCYTLTLSRVTFTVNEKNRQKVLATKQKNVHAYVKGYLESNTMDSNQLFNEITYNPYKYNSFVNKTTLEPVYSKDLVLLNERGMFSNV
jgi:hypothetical protein